MQVGLLWFDNDPLRGLSSKIEDAARCYREKFGRPPDTCYVNSLVFGKGPELVAASSVRQHGAACRAGGQHLAASFLGGRGGGT